MARVHTQSWQETYAGLIAPDYLAQATTAQAQERREQNWYAITAQNKEAVFVAERGGEVVAFASVGPARDHPGYAYELTTLYSLRRVQGQGVGQALLQAVMGQVQEEGGKTLALWVLSSNPARQWYAAQEAGEKVRGSLAETRMVWDTLPAGRPTP